MRVLLLALTLLAFSGSYSQDTSHLRISLLTCSPGEELYSTFGHSGIRVTDTTTRTDIVFNYGTFDGFDPDFYMKFVKGKLDYYVEADQFRDFVYTYQMDGRSVVEQELDLTAEEKIRLYKALRENLKEENKYYRYDFLFDNCATRIRDIIRNNTNNLQFPNLLPPNQVTFRHLIYEYLDANKAWWSKLGIDILLGAGMDKYANSDQSMFLPDYLYKGFDSALVSNTHLVSKRKTLIAETAEDINTSFFTPTVTFCIILMVFVVLAVLRKTQLLRLLDFILFLASGLLGILLIVMWTATEHQLCANNYNLLWAVPLHTIAAFTIFSKQRSIPTYWKASAIIAALLLLLWIVLPQNMNEALIPIVILLGWRSWVLGKS